MRLISSLLFLSGASKYLDLSKLQCMNGDLAEESVLCLRVVCADCVDQLRVCLAIMCFD